jgi:hypothetical protein
MAKRKKLKRRRVNLPESSKSRKNLNKTKSSTANQKLRKMAGRTTKSNSRLLGRPYSTN